MKRQVRCGVFETNSSSTHSIAIPKKADKTADIYFYIGEYGWAWREVDPASYFYTALYVTSDNEVEANERVEQMKEILDSNRITYSLGDAETSVSPHSGYFYLDNGYIDHGDELNGFVRELLDDGDKLIRFLSGGKVFTGNDNEYCFDDPSRKVTNREDYEWYYKGN